MVVRLWDSWEDDAVIRDVATGRYVDRDRLHYIDFVGEFFSVKGPSITPRSPQAHPLVVVRDEPDALPVVARWADVVRVAAPDLAAAHTAREQVRAVVTGRRARPRRGRRAPRRRPGTDGPDESVARPSAAARPTASRCSAAPTPASPHGSTNSACAARSPGTATLRERFGLSRPANYFAGAHR